MYFCLATVPNLLIYKTYNQLKEDLIFSSHPSASKIQVFEVFAVNTYPYFDPREIFPSHKQA